MSNYFENYIYLKRKFMILIEEYFLYLVIMALRVTPVPIPNTKVKPYRADGTARAALWKSRLLPGQDSYF